MAECHRAKNKHMANLLQEHEPLLDLSGAFQKICQLWAQ